MIPSTTGMAKLVMILFPAGKQTCFLETAASPDFLAKVLQQEPTFLQSAYAAQTAPSTILPAGLTLDTGQATVGKPFPASRLPAVIPATTGIAKLLVIALPAGKQTFLAETAGSPDFLANVLQHESTPLQSA